jgi:integrase
MEGIKYQKNRDTEKRLIPTLEEFEAIVQSIRVQNFSDTAKESGDLVEFMGLAGLGQAECAGLRWGDINFTSSIVTIIRAKTGHQFDFPIYPTLRPLLERLNSERPEKGRSATDPVFAVFNPKVALENACSRLGLPNYTARSLRRMHITRCLELGIDPQTIAAWQGHRDGGQLILRTYGRVSKAHQMNMAARLSPKITPIAQGDLAGQV